MGVSQLCNTRGGGGTLTLESVTGMFPGHDPPFSGQSVLPWPLPTNLPSMRRLRAPFSVFRKKFAFLALILAEILALYTHIFFFLIFVPKTPHFSRKIRSLDPTFENPCGTHAHPPKKKKLSASYIEHSMLKHMCLSIEWIPMYSTKRLSAKNLPLL